MVGSLLLTCFLQFIHYLHLQERLPCADHDSRYYPPRPYCRDS
jgi:hypothetical protein